MSIGRRCADTSRDVTSLRKDVAMAAPALPLSALLTMGDETDTSGRLLLEDSAPERGQQRARRRGIAMRSIPCPYEDTPSRLGGAMNTSAYEALRGDVAGVLDGFAWLAAEDLARKGAAPRPMTPQLLYEVSYLGITLPMLLLRRANAPLPAHGGLPTVVASIFKASRGLFSVSIALLNDGAPGRRIDAASVVAYADRHGNLVRPEPPRVCAAPTRLIERTIGVILGGEGGDASASALSSLVAFDLLWDLVRVQDELNQALSTYASVQARLWRSAGNSAENLFNLRVPGTTGTFGQMTEAMVGHANDAQRRLNRQLGRSGDAPPIGYQQLLALL